MWKRTTSRIFDDQQDKVATPRGAGGIPRRGEKRQLWRRRFLPLAVQGLAIILSSCLGFPGPQASAQGPQASVPMVAEPGPEGNAEGDRVAAPGDVRCQRRRLCLAGRLWHGLPAVLVRSSGSVVLCQRRQRTRSIAVGRLCPAGVFQRVGVCGSPWDASGTGSEALEFSYVGPFEWQASGETSGAAPNSRFFVPNGDVDISAFNDAEFHRQTYESTLHSVEINERYFDWDTMSCLLGLRYIDFQEDFSFEIPRPRAGGGTRPVHRPHAQSPDRSAMRLGCDPPDRLFRPAEFGSTKRNWASMPIWRIPKCV